MPLRVVNVQAGIWKGNRFIPFRRSRDYDPDDPRLREEDSGSRTDAAGVPWLKEYRKRYRKLHRGKAARKKPKPTARKRKTAKAKAKRRKR